MWENLIFLLTTILYVPDLMKGTYKKKTSLKEDIHLCVLCIAYRYKVLKTVAAVCF